MLKRTGSLLVLSLLIGAASILVVTANASDAPQPRAEPAAGSGGSPSADTSGSKRAVLRLKNSRFGKVIFEKNSGLVAYLFTKDGKSKSKCYGGCAKAWPPIKTKESPKAGKGLKQKHIGVAKRRGGGKMVTYKGRPLYFYVDDGPGEILCHDVFQFGGTWYAVNKKGKPA